MRPAKPSEIPDRIRELVKQGCPPMVASRKALREVAAARARSAAPNTTPPHSTPSPEDELAGMAGRGEDVPTDQPKKKALTLTRADLARVAKKRKTPIETLRRQAEKAGYTVVDDSPRPVTADSWRVTGDGGATLHSVVIPGTVAGVAGVFQERTLDERGQPKTGLSLDEMLDRLRQDARFHWLESTDDLIDAIVYASRHPISVDVFPGTTELKEYLGMDPATAWWEDSWQAPQEQATISPGSPLPPPVVTLLLFLI